MENNIAFILVFIGIIIVAVGIIMEIILIKGGSSVQYEEFEKDYIRYIKKYNICGMIAIICMWFFTTGKINKIANISLMLISAAWFAVFMYSIFKAIYIKIKESPDTLILGRRYLNISQTCLVRFAVTAIIVWLIR